jgi:hypothetical protein
MPKIAEIFAFVCEDKGPDDEGIVGIKLGKEWTPLVGADMKRVALLRPIAEDIAKKTGKKIKLIHFTNREELEEIG